MGSGSVRFTLGWGCVMEGGLLYAPDRVPELPSAQLTPLGGPWFHWTATPGE